MFAIDSNGCRDLPFIDSFMQTYYDYANGNSGYIVFAVGIGLLIVSMVSRKQLGKLPGWLAAILIAALTIGALPAILPAFGVNLGCGAGVVG